MDSKTIQTKIDKLAKAALNAGLMNVTTEYRLRNDVDPQIVIQHQPASSSWADKWEYFRDGDIFAKAQAWINALPSPEETARKEFATLIGKALEYGRAKGFDDVMINPLADAMKHLSENAIEHLPGEGE